MAGLTDRITINGMELMNRLVMPPLTTWKSSASDGEVTYELISHYDEKTRGGYLGLVIMEHAYISQEGKASKGQLSIASDDRIPGLRKLVDTIHGNGVKVVCQINHAGGKTGSDITGVPSAGPYRPLAEGLPAPDRMLTTEAIIRAEDQFAAAAVRAKEAGFDGVEVHSAHGYLLCQFFSPLVNHRSDEYGGSLEQRIRIHLETIRKVREAVGPDYPVFIRLGCVDDMPGGSVIGDAAAACRKFQEAGADLIDISGGMSGFIRKGMENVQGYYGEVSEEVKKNVDIPVLVTGGITEAKAADELIRQGRSDLTGVGRAILKDSEWPRKAMTQLKGE